MFGAFKKLFGGSSTDGNNSLEEQEKLKQKQLEEEKVRLEEERLEKEAKRLEEEKLAKEKAEQERIQREKEEQERLEKERLEAERLAKERAEQERLEQERLEAEKLAKEKAEQEQLEREKNDEKPKRSFFGRALEKTIGNFKSIVPKKKEKIEFDIIEELLIEADMEYEIVEKAMDGLPDLITRDQLRHRLVMLFEHAPDVNYDNIQKPFIELIIGVNGAGKTTTIAKLANSYKKDGKTVLLGAGDTFRAAAIEQLSSWASKLDLPIIKTKQGHDPSAVAFDTIHSAIAKNIDHAIIDTAGRLQTQTNLNNELKKIVKVCSKAKENSPDRKIMILDGTQGNSAIAQAKAFNEMIDIDGIIVTKLDGTAKGGALFSISNQLELPIFYVGVGENADDLITFSPDDFVDSLLDGIYTDE